jgi:hypothetical protein
MDHTIHIHLDDDDVIKLEARPNGTHWLTLDFYGSATVFLNDTTLANLRAALRKPDSDAEADRRATETVLLRDRQRETLADWLRDHLAEVGDDPEVLAVEIVDVLKAVK